MASGAGLLAKPWRSFIARLLIKRSVTGPESYSPLVRLSSDLGSPTRLTREFPLFGPLVGVTFTDGTDGMCSPARNRPRRYSRSQEITRLG